MYYCEKSTSQTWQDGLQNYRNSIYSNVDTIKNIQGVS